MNVPQVPFVAQGHPPSSGACHSIAGVPLTPGQMRRVAIPILGASLCIACGAVLPARQRSTPAPICARCQRLAEV